MSELRPLPGSCVALSVSAVPTASAPSGTSTSGGGTREPSGPVLGGHSGAWHSPCSIALGGIRLLKVISLVLIGIMKSILT